MPGGLRDRAAGVPGPSSIPTRAGVVGDRQRLLEALHLAVALLGRIDVAGRRNGGPNLAQELVELEAELLEVAGLELLERQLARDDVALRDVAHHRVGGSAEE